MDSYSRTGPAGGDLRDLYVSLGPDVPPPNGHGPAAQFALRREDIASGGHEWSLELVPASSTSDAGRLLWRLPNDPSGAYVVTSEQTGEVLALYLWQTKSLALHRHPQLFLRGDLGLGMEALVFLATLGAGDLVGMHKGAVKVEREWRAEETERKRREMEEMMERRRRAAAGTGSGGGDGGGGGGGCGGGGGGKMFVFVLCSDRSLTVFE